MEAKEKIIADSGGACCEIAVGSGSLTGSFHY